MGCAPQYAKPWCCHQCLKHISTTSTHTCQDCKAAHWCSSKCKAADQLIHVRCGECALYAQQDVCEALGLWCREVCVVLRCLVQPSPAPPLLSHAHHVLPALKQCHGDGWVDKMLCLLCLLSMPATDTGGPAGPDTASGSTQEASRVEAPQQSPEQQENRREEDWRQVVINALCAVVVNAIEVQLLFQGPSSAVLPAAPQDQLPGAASGSAQSLSDQLLQLQAAPPVALFKTFSRLNHSCRPNAVFHVTPGQPAPRVHVHAVRPVHLGEEVSITYIDLLTPKAARQQELADKYAFTCTCPRCSGINAVPVDPHAPKPVLLHATPARAPGSVQSAASVHKVDFSHPDWFLSHVSSTGPQETGEEDAKQLEAALQELHTQTLGMVQETPYRVWEATWPQLARLWSAGVNPFHQVSLSLLSLVATACTAAATDTTSTSIQPADNQQMGSSATGADGVAVMLTRATLCNLAICSALEQLLDAGETGIILHAIHVYTELATSLCLLIKSVLSDASLCPESISNKLYANLTFQFMATPGVDLTLELMAAMGASTPATAGSGLVPTRVASVGLMKPSRMLPTCAASLSAACRLLQVANPAAVDTVMFLPFILNLPYAQAAQLVAQCQQGLRGHV